MAEKLKKFKWDNFYCEHNATILENLLDRKTVKFGELLDLFFPRPIEGKNKITKQAIFKLFKTKLNEWRLELIKAWPAYFLYSFIPDTIIQLDSHIIFALYKLNTLSPFPHLIVSAKNYYRDLKNNTEIFVDPLLAIIISHNLMPEELRRLPRLSSKQCGFSIEKNYFQELDILTNDGIVESAINSTDAVPVLLNYGEIKDTKDKFKTENDIFKALLANKIGAYIKVKPEHVFTTSIRFVCRGYLSFYRRGNCGNPYYSKRYKFLERLSLKQVKALWIDGRVTLNSFHMLNIVQSTDIETKFHIERTLNSFNGKRNLELSDLVFLEDEINKFNINSLPLKNDDVEGDDTVTDEWIIEARKIANEIALERWKAGIQEITARNICDSVAKRIGEQRKYWGNRGPRSSSNVRKEALTGWLFNPPD